MPFFAFPCPGAANAVAMPAAPSARSDPRRKAPRRVYALARLAFKEAIRRRILFVIGLFLVGLLLAGWYPIRPATIRRGCISASC